MIQDLKDARVDFDTEIGLNVVDISLKFNDTLFLPVNETEDGLKPEIKLIVGEDDLLELQASMEFPPMTIDSFEILDGTGFSKEIDLPMFSDFYSEGKLIFGFNLNSFSKDEEGEFSNIKLDSIKLDKGQLIIDLNTYTHFFSSFSFRFPGITTASNQMLSIENFIPTPQHHTLEIDLSNNKIEILRKNFSEYFLVELDYYLESKNNSDTTIVPKIMFEMGEMDIEYFYGSLGNYTLENEVFTTPVFDNKILEGQEFEVDIRNPEINLNFRNQLGLPLKIGIDFAKMIFADSSEVQITGLPDLVIVEAPLLEERDEIKTTKITIDPNTNLDLLISKSPTEVQLGYQIITNPSNPFQQNYFRDSDTLFADLEVRIPFELYVSEINLDNKSQVDFFSSFSSAKIKPTFAQIKSEISNSFPFELFVQSFFIDQDSVVLDSLFDREIKIEGSVDVNNPNTVNIETLKDNEQLKNLYNCTHIITVATFQTTNAQKRLPVKFFGESELKIELTFLSKLNVNSGE